MPPPNSVTATPPTDPSTSPFLELEALAGPVPDLASTLTTTQAEQDANDDNVSFLRTPIPRSDIGISSNMDRVYRDQLRRDRDHRFTQHRGSESQRRTHTGTAPNERRYNPSEWRELQDRAMSLRSHAGYQGWAPPDGRTDSESQHGLPTMSRSSAEFYDDHRRALVSFARHLESSTRDSPLSAPRVGATTSAPSTTESLRTAALLQSVRSRDPSTRSRSGTQNHLLERERSGLESPTSRDQYSTSDQRRRSALGSRSGRQRDHSPSAMSSTLHDQARRDWIMNGTQRQQEEEEEELQRPQEGSMWNLEDAIKYLERLRFCDSHEDSLSSATAGGFAGEEFLDTNHEDFILDTAMIDPPAESSWLKIGGIFSGSQHASHGSSHLVRNRSDARGSRHTDLPQLGQAQTLPTNRHSFSYTLSNPATRSPGINSRNRASLSFFENVDRVPQFRTLPLNSTAEQSLAQSSAAKHSEERWPVQVKIHSIDYKTMTLAGTMEAFNVPDQNSVTQKSSITTFLEGEIIDFNKFTLRTKSYKTDENTDSIYWRMLEPFKKLTDDEMVRGLLSKRWLRERLREKYILMRWKEKCFVKPLDAHALLTISGFYYVSMRRSDGRIESLYYDPQSAPFQHLSMMPEARRQFPAYQFT
ncbi:MAG: hypothetical protein Q9168_001672 [Polycauliona sp. 1 TL-2023]